MNKGFHGITGYDSHPKEYLDMNPGDTILFHPLLIHGSGPNTSQVCIKRCTPKILKNFPQFTMIIIIIIIILCLIVYENTYNSTFLQQTFFFKLTNNKIIHYLHLRLIMKVSTYLVLTLPTFEN